MTNTKVSIFKNPPTHYEYSNLDLRKLILPLFIEQVLAMAVGMADTIMIAVMGEAAVSGVSLVDSVNVLFINVFSALATGGAVVVGHFLGQKNTEQGNRAGWQIILFSTATAIVISVIFILFHHSILRLMFGSIEEDVMTASRIYLVITALSFPALAIYNSCAAIFRSMNKAKVTMWISLMMNGINLVGNAICIFGLKMGVAGAAVPTTISRVVAAAVIFYMMFSGKNPLTFKGYVTLKVNFDLIKKILFIAIPSGAESSLFQLGKLLTLSLVSTFGTYSIAANAVCNTLAGWNNVFGNAVNLALVSVSAVCIGASSIEQTRYYTRKLAALARMGMLVMGVVIYFSAPWLVQMYNLSPEASELSIRVIRTFNFMSILLWPESFTLPNTLRSAGDVFYAMVVAIGSMWIFRIGAAYFLTYVFHLGLMGVWIAMYIDWGFRGLCYGLRMHGHKWEHMMR